MQPISPAAILNSRIPVVTASGRPRTLPAFVAGPLAVVQCRQGDASVWVVVHVASGYEISSTAEQDGMRAILNMGALLSLSIDWTAPQPLTEAAKKLVATVLEIVRGAVEL